MMLLLKIDINGLVNMSLAKFQKVNGKVDSYSYQTQKFFLKKLCIFTNRINLFFLFNINNLI